MIVVNLPLPNKRLNPNRSKGRHWGATAALRKSARYTAFVLTTQAAASTAWHGIERRKTDTVALTITFMHPDRRARDRDNLLAACKPSLDGVADALKINDSQFDPVLLRQEYGTAPGGVRIEIGAPARNTL